MIDLNTTLIESLSKATATVRELKIPIEIAREAPKVINKMFIETSLHEDIGKAFDYELTPDQAYGLTLVGILGHLVAFELNEKDSSNEQKN